ELPAKVNKARVFIKSVPIQRNTIGSNDKGIVEKKWLFPDEMQIGFMEREKDFPFLSRKDMWP
ncbi:hypothetical protein Tco_0257039, partial [Tanacetum coccineum]